MILIVTCLHSASATEVILFQDSVKKTPHVLTADELELFRQRTIDKINEVQEYFSEIASSENDMDSRKLYMDLSLDHFINRGKDVNMEVSFVKNGVEKRAYRPLDAYLQKLATLPYAKVVIKASKSCVVSNFLKKGVDENGKAIYTATATIYQEFEALDKEGETVYKDVTKKTVEVEVREVKDLFGTRWSVLLGDISVAQTRTT